MEGEGVGGDVDEGQLPESLQPLRRIEVGQHRLQKWSAETPDDRGRLDLNLRQPTAASGYHTPSRKFPAKSGRLPLPSGTGAPPSWWPDTTYLIAAVLLAASITFALRALPLAERGGADRRGDDWGGRHGRGLHWWRSNAVLNLC